MKDQVNQPIGMELLASCPTPMLLLDSDGHIVAANPALLALAGVDATAVTGKNAADLDNALATLATHQGEFNWSAADGSLRALAATEQRLADGSAVRWVQDHTDLQGLISERDELREELKAHSLTDPVTGLMNQRGVMLALEPQVARSRRYSTDMSVIMMDARCADDSDAFQVEVARLLKDQLRWADVIGCTEDREFILVLPETTRDAAMKLADKLAEKLAELSESAHACYGVTEWQKTDNAGALLRRAATALEQSRSEQNGIAVAL